MPSQELFDFGVMLIPETMDVFRGRNLTGFECVDNSLRHDPIALQTPALSRKVGRAIRMGSAYLLYVKRCFCGRSQYEVPGQRLGKSVIQRCLYKHPHLETQSFLVGTAVSVPLQKVPAI